MRICKLKRILIPVSISLFSASFTISEKIKGVIYIPILYFLGVYFLLINFPKLVEITKKKPVYIDDLILGTVGQKNRLWFKNIYLYTMFFLLSILFSIFIDYFISNGFHNKPLLEVCGIIGGNLLVYSKIQDIIGRILLNFCHCVKEQHEMSALSRVSSFSRNSPIIMESEIDEVIWVNNA